MKWTEDQQAAIEARNDQILVSAAAGSGKTAVLVERVLSMLRAGGRVDRMLIVTFTRAAAAEMRERLGKRLSAESGDNPHLRRQMMRLHQADICTLHVFCKRLIQQHFEVLGVDPLCKVAEQSRLNLLKTQAMDETLEAFYDNPNEDEAALIDQFEDEDIVEFVDRALHFLLSLANPWEWADNAVQESGDVSHWLPLLQEMAEARLHSAGKLLDDMEALIEDPNGPQRYADTLEKDRMLQDEMENDPQSGKPSFAQLTRKKAPPEEDAQLTDRYKKLREQWKKRLGEALSLFPADKAAAQAELAYTLKPLRAVLGLARKLNERYFELKQNKNYLDYNDLEHLALKAMSVPHVREAVVQQYDALFIDEYQDISGIQEAIISALHEYRKNSLFMVGDVKQSIYRFRLADPTLFLKKYETFSTAADADCRKILLQQNFRSDANILLATNQVFRHTMHKRQTEIEYDDDAALKPGGGQPLGAPVELHLIAAPEADEEEEDTDTATGFEWEAAFVVQRIQQLLQEATVREGDQVRPVRYRDIAILIRAASNKAPIMARTLQLAGIPVYSDADAQFYELPDVADMINLLRVLDNPLRDVALLSVLRCPCFEFTEEELARIRLTLQGSDIPFYIAFQKLLEQDTPLAEKAREAWDTLERWRFLSNNLPLHSLIWRILQESGLYARAGALPEGEQRQANLRLLLERACNSDAAKEGLNAFLQENGVLHMQDDSRTAKTLSENEDVVRILTFHKSKGLEFPVVFLVDLARKFHISGGVENKLRFHAKYGAGMQYVDMERCVTHEPCSITALKGAAEREDRAEEARLLYVGMTRARERLILVASPKKLENAMQAWSRPATPEAAGEAKCMLDWICTSLGGFHAGDYTAENGSLWRMTRQSISTLNQEEPEHAVIPDLPDGEPSDETVAWMTRTLRPRRPLKVSVTAMSHPFIREEDTWENMYTKLKQTVTQAPDGLSVKEPEDPFMDPQKRITAAKRGTVNHRVLGILALEPVRGGHLAEALQQLVEEDKLSPIEQEVLRRDWIRSFYQSPVGQRMLQSNEVHREWSFVIEAEGYGLLQGVIDLCFREEDGWVLIDYKTDRLSNEELLERYQQQINCYAWALERLSGVRVKEKYLFALRSGEAVPVNDCAEWRNNP